MNRNSFKWLAVIVVIATVVISTAAYLQWGLDREDEQRERIMITEMIDNAIMQRMSTSITVSKIISQDNTLKDMLKDEWKYSDDEIIYMMRNYLNDIQKKFGFASVYVISESSKKYFTYIGLNKVIDPENDAFDMWYVNFLEGGKDYEFESSTDQVNRDKLTIFVDGRVEDEYGNVIGVSGVGMETEDIQMILSDYETKYGVRIDYVSEDGLIQMSSRTAAVHLSYVTGVTLPDSNNKEYVYQNYGMDGFAVIRYVEELGWYLVVRSEATYGGVQYNYKFFFAQAFILLFALMIIIIAAKNSDVEIMKMTSKDQNVDILTGLTNKQYFTKIYGENGILNTTQYQTIAEFDIDDYESIEKNFRFQRILLSVVKLAKEYFGPKGQIMRWEENSFVILSELSIDEVDEICRQFCKAVADMGDVTVSIGVTEIDLSETLMKNYYRAVQNLYLVKELGGNNVKRGD